MEKAATARDAGYDVDNLWSIQVRQTLDINTLFDLFVHQAFLFFRISDVNMYIVMK